MHDDVAVFLCAPPEAARNIVRRAVRQTSNGNVLSQATTAGMPGGLLGENQINYSCMEPGSVRPFPFHRK